MYLLDLLTAVLVRLVLLVHSLLVIWLAVTMTQQQWYWLLAVAVLAMLVESLVTITVNKAQEWKWFCPCFLAYLCSTIPGIWVLELKKTDWYKGSFNHSSQTTTLGIHGVTIPVEFELQTWVTIMEQLFLYLMILSRWVLPRGEITRNELSQLLFVFIGIASDITEFFALSEEHKVRESAELPYIILGVWTVSLLQFTFVLTATHSPKKRRIALASVSTGLTQEVEIDDEPENSCIKGFFKTEVWSICVNFFLQDGPFLSVRLYTMIVKSFLNYSIIFFTAKNALVVMLLVYRLSVLCLEKKHHKPKPEKVPVPSLSSKHSLTTNESKQSMGDTVIANKSLNNSLASISNDINQTDYDL